MTQTEALIKIATVNAMDYEYQAWAREALAHPEQEPEFVTHNVEQPYDWSEWVCPDPKGYLMKCCDCGLVHEAEFGVVRYKSETEREDCDMVDDSNLQAVFRMRRSEQWSPEDTAHRAGGLPMAQPKQIPPSVYSNTHQPQQCLDCGSSNIGVPATYDSVVDSVKKQQEPVACQHKRYSIDVHEQTGNCIDCGAEGRMSFIVGNTTPPQRKPLTEEQIEDEWEKETGHSIFGGDRSDGRAMYISPDEVVAFARNIEVSHGIKE